MYFILRTSVTNCVLQFAFQAGLRPFKFAPGKFSRLFKFNPVEFSPASAGMTYMWNSSDSAPFNLNFDLLSSFCVKAEGFVVNVNQLAVFDVFGIMDTTGLYIACIPFIKIYFLAVRNKAVG